MGLWEPLGCVNLVLIHTTSHSEPISVTRRIALIVIYSRSRIPPPLWDLNLGKLCYLVPVNCPPYPTSLNTHCEDPSMAYSLAIPRQLVPTVGQEALQALQRARTKIFAGISETVAIGHVLFSGNVPIVPLTSSGSRRRQTPLAARSSQSKTSTSSSAKPTRALVP